MLLTYNLRIRNADPHFHLISCYKKHFLGLKWKILFLICGMLLYPILMPNFEKPRALVPLCIISYKSQNLYVLFDTSHDDFRCLETELQPFF